MNSRDHNTPKLKRRKYLPLLHRYAVSFNGVDEYLTLPLPNNDLLASPGVGDFYSSGSAIAGWDLSGTIDWAGATSGKTYTNTILISAESGISKAISGLRVGQKYKLKIRYQAGSVGLNIASEQYGSDYFTLPDTFGEWNTTSKVFTAVSTTIWIGCGIEAAILDWVSVKHDQGLDANLDQEMILYSGDANFNNPTTRWVPKDGSSNQTCALSTVDKAEGTGSNLITATGAGDVTNNYVKLPFEFLEPLVAGKKYTIEGKARLDPASLVYGAELFTAFTASVAHPYETCTISGNAITSAINSTGNGSVYVADIISANAGDIIKVTFDFTLNSGAAPLLRVATLGETIQSTKSSIYTCINGTNTAYLVMTVNDTLGDIMFSNVGDVSNWSLSNLSIKKATPVTITQQIGTKSVNSGALSIAQGVFTKFVLNFEATNSEVNADWKSYLSGAGAVFVDELSFTQKYDMIGISKHKMSGGNYIIGCGNSFRLIRQSDTFFITDGVYALSGTAGVLNAWMNVLIKITNEGGESYFNGVLNSTDTDSIGKLIQTSALTVGARNGVIDFHNGQIATVQIIRFDNIALTDFNPNTYKPGYKITDLGGGVPEVVLHLDPKDGSSVANMLKDYSPKGHVITAVNIDLSNRVVVRN